MAMEIVRRNGQITKVAWDPEPLELSLDPLLARSITLQGVFSHTWDTWEHVLRLEAAGMVRLRELVTHRFPLHQWREAYEALESGEAVKALLIPA
jgi:alcohol dehydrogenase/L-iditol 2-dehydrogenase